MMLMQLGMLNPLKAHESSLPVEGTMSPTSERINPALPEEVVTASPKGAVLQDRSNPPQGPPLPRLFASRPVTRV